MIVDASVVVDAICDPGPRGEAARGAVGGQPVFEPLIAPGHFAVEVMSALRAAANRPTHPFQPADIPGALEEAEGYGIHVESTPWGDIRRAWVLSEQSLRYTDAVYVATAERHEAILLTTDARIERSGADIRCRVLTVAPPDDAGR